MTTVTATQAGTTKVAKAGGWAGVKQTAVGVIPDLSAAAGTAPVTTGPLLGDIYRMVKLPKGAVITGGRLFGSRFASGASAGSVCATLNIGLSGGFVTQDGTVYAAATASAAMGNTWAIDFTAVVGGKAESGLDVQLGGLLYTKGPLTLSDDQFAIITFLSSAGSFVSAAALGLEVEYYMGVHA